jgi:site-specific DNA-cytosine methylase
MDSVDEDPMSEYSTAQTPRSQRLTMLAQTGWPEGWSADKAYDAAIAAGLEPELGRTDKIRSPYTARRWKWNEPGRVVTGGFLDEAVHPRRDRTFTHREAATLMGLPLRYDVTPILRAKSKGRTWYGKATPVEPASFIFQGVVNHLEAGSELPSTPKEIEKNIYMLDLEEALAASKTRVVAAQQDSLWS